MTCLENGVEITGVDPGAVEELVDLWVALARGQREHGSHLRAETNRTRVRELFARCAANNRLFVARLETDDRVRAGRGDTDGARETDVVGFVMFRTRSDRYEVDCIRGLVENLYVVPEYRRSGIGSALLSAAESRLRERGVEILSLEAMADNEDARRFYRQHGYEPHRVEFEKRLDES